MFLESFIAAIGWSILSIVVSQTISVGLMWWLGLSPKKLAHEIEDVQNVAVGAVFFIVSLSVSLFVGVYFSNGFTEFTSFADSALWFVSGLVMGLVLMTVIFFIAHRLLDRLEGETVYRYIRRELIEEQNAALAWFLGGLSIPVFIAAVFQII